MRQTPPTPDANFEFDCHFLPSLCVSSSEDRGVYVWSTKDGAVKSKIDWKAQDGEPLNMKYPQFLDDELVIMTAAGPRGPARVRSSSLIAK